MVCSNKNNRTLYYFFFVFFLGTVLFAVTGGTETLIKKVYMIDARTGDILTSFDSNPVNKNYLIYEEKKKQGIFLLAFNGST